MTIYFSLNKLQYIELWIKAAIFVQVMHFELQATVQRGENVSEVDPEPTILLFHLNHAQRHIIQRDLRPILQFFFQDIVIVSGYSFKPWR